MGAKAGIAGFHKWFSGAFPTAVIDAFPKQQELYDHVCIDMNQVRSTLVPSPPWRNKCTRGVSASTVLYHGQEIHKRRKQDAMKQQ